MTDQENSGARATKGAAAARLGPRFNFNYFSCLYFFPLLEYFFLRYLDNNLNLSPVKLDYIEIKSLIHETYKYQSKETIFVIKISKYIILKLTIV